MFFDTLTCLICADCLQILANDDASSLEYHYGDEAAAREAEIREQLALAASDGWEWAVDGASYGFSSTCCDGCGSALAGDRFAANLMRPRQPTPPRPAVPGDFVTVDCQADDHYCASMIGQWRAARWILSDLRSLRWDITLNAAPTSAPQPAVAMVTRDLVADLPAGQVSWDREHADQWADSYTLCWAHGGDKPAEFRGSAYEWRGYARNVAADLRRLDFPARASLY